MGDAQSAQREDKCNAATAEEDEDRLGRQMEDGQNEAGTIHTTNGQISEISRKVENPVLESNGQCEEEIATEALISPDLNDCEVPNEDEVSSQNIIFNLNEIPDEMDANQGNEVIEMNSKQDDINESFKKFFSNISLKLTLRRGSEDKAAIPIEENEEGTIKRADSEDCSNEVTTENAQQNTDRQTAKESTCLTPSYDISEKQTKEEFTANAADEEAIYPSTDAATSKDYQSGSGPDGNEITTQFKKFFTTGIFTGLRKRKRHSEDRSSEKEMVNTEEEVSEPINQKSQAQSNDEKITSSFERATIDRKLGEVKVRQESFTKTKDEAETTSIISNEMTNSQEKVQESPLKRLLSGSSLKKRAKKHRVRKSSDAKLSDSGEHGSDQLTSSTESAENKKEDAPLQASPEAAVAEDGAWASFKKLVSPQKRQKRPSMEQGDGQIPSLVIEGKQGENEHVSDVSTEEGKKRKDSIVSWEAVLCGSGRRRSRKTSDSEDDMPQMDHEEEPAKEPKEVQLGVSTEMKGTGSPMKEDEESTWKSFKRIVTPKRKVKEDGENSSEVDQYDSTFSIRKFLSGRKQSKSVEVPVEVASKDTASSDEDSEIPAVIPLSEFDITETEDQTKPGGEIESYTNKEASKEVQCEFLHEMTEPVPLQDSEPLEIKEKECIFVDETSALPDKKEEPDEQSESTSQHQLLSDITEEGVLTETTPALVDDEATRDETISEDIIEITSEAVTAPEPVDAALADETEMVSACSQLTESSKTSCNATPVPAEYTVMNTESLLQQVSETITRSLTEVPLLVEEPISEKAVCSVSHQIRASPLKEEPKILELHSRSDVTDIKTGLSADTVDAVNEVPATAQTESINHLREALSTEIAPEVPTEKLDTADSATEEGCKVNVLEVQENRVLDLDKECRQTTEGQVEVNEKLNPDILLAREEVEQIRDNLDQAETEILTLNISEERLSIAVEDKTKDVDEQKKDHFETEDDANLKTPSEQAQNDNLLPAVTAEVKEMAQEQMEEVDFQVNKVQPQDDVESLNLNEPKETEHLPEATEESQMRQTKTNASVDTQETEATQFQTQASEEEVVQPDIKEPPGSESFTPPETNKAKKDESVSEIAEEPKNKKQPTDEANINTEGRKMSEGVESATLEAEENVIKSLNQEPSHPDNISPPEIHTQDLQEYPNEASDNIETEEALVAVGGINKDDVEEVFQPAQASATELQMNVVQWISGEDNLVSAEKDKEDSQQDPFQSGETAKHETTKSITTDHFDVGEEQTLESSKYVVSELNQKALPTESISEDEKCMEEPKELESLPDELQNKQNQPTNPKTEQEGEKELDVESSTVESEEHRAQSLDNEELASKSATICQINKADQDQTVSELTDDLQHTEFLQMDELVIDKTAELLHVIQSPNTESEEDTCEPPQMEQSVLKREKGKAPDGGKHDEPAAELTCEPHVKEPQTAETILEENGEEREVLQLPTAESEGDGNKSPHNEESVLKDKTANEVDKSKHDETVSEQTYEFQSKEPQMFETIIDETAEELQVVQSHKSGLADTPQFPSKGESVSESTKADQPEEVNLDETEPKSQTIINQEEEGPLDVPPTQEDEVQLFCKDESVSENLMPTSKDISEEEVSGTQVTDEVQIKEPQTHECEIDSTKTTEVLECIQAPTQNDKPQIEDTDRLQDKEPQPDDAERSKEEISEMPVCVQASTSENGDAAILSVIDGELFIQDVQPKEKDTDTPKQVESPIELRDEPKADFSEAAETEMFQTVQQTKLESEEIKFEILGNNVTQEDTPLLTKEEEPRREPELLTEKDDSLNERAQKPDLTGTILCDPDRGTSETPEDAATFDTTTVEQDTSELKLKEAKTTSEESSVETELSPLGDKDDAAETEIKADTHYCPTAQTGIISTTQKTEGQTLTDTVTDETETIDSKQLDQESESLPHDAQVELEEIPKLVEDIQAVPAVHIHTVNDEQKSTHVFETKVTQHEVHPTVVADVLNEPTHEVILSENQESVAHLNVENLPSSTINVAIVNHTVVAKDVLTALKDISAQKFDSVVEELPMGATVSEAECHGLVETAPPLATDYEAETAEGSNTGLMMNVLSVESEVEQRIQVQLTDADVGSAENTADTSINVGLIEDNDILDVCYETTVEKLLASSETEEHSGEEHATMVQEITQLVMTNLSETTLNSDADESLVCPTSDSNDVNYEIMEDSTETNVKQQDEEAAADIDKSAVSAENQKPEDPEEKIDVQGPEIILQDTKKKSEQTKDDFEKYEHVASQQTELKKPSEHTTETLPTHRDAESVAAENTGVMSSAGNLQSPSSLSLEFKLNIQFGQTKLPLQPSSSPMERVDAEKPVKTSELAAQTEELIEPQEQSRTTQSEQNKKIAELNVAAVQATRIIEPPANFHSSQRAVIATQPVLQDVCVQVMDITEPVEQCAERVILNVEAAELIQPARRQRRALCVSKPELSWAPLKQAEEELEQDVWLDAEEDIYPQVAEERCSNEGDKPAEQQPEPDFEMANKCEMKNNEGQQDQEIMETSEIESEGEDFAAALEELGSSMSAVEEE